MEQFDLLELNSIWSNQGCNKNLGLISPPQINASNDLGALKIWLNEFNQSPNTFRAYAKEIRRLCLYCVRVAQKSLSEFSYEDFLEYEKFIQAPYPLDVWCGPSKPWDHEDWRPFRSPLSPKSAQQALTIVSSAVQFLVDSGYLLTNPLKLRRNTTRKLRMSQAKVANSALDRVFSREYYDNLVLCAKQMDYGSRKPEQRKARYLFLLNFLYELAPRLSEISNAKMRDFSKREDGWYWSTIGKGFKQACLPCSNELIESLAYYRHSFGLMELPDSSDINPLFLRLSARSDKSTSALVDPSAIYKELLNLLSMSSSWLAENTTVDISLIAHISTHWFRHSAITDFYDNSKDIRLTAEFSRHENIQTTMKYTHSQNADIRRVINRRKQDN